jgi:hypothetical protein
VSRASFISGKPRPEKPIAPDIGQRWVCNFTDEEILKKVLKLPEDKRDTMLGFWEYERKKGFVIVGEGEFKYGPCWIIHKNPNNPHPRSREHEFAKEWLKNYKFLKYEEGFNNPREI